MTKTTKYCEKGHKVYLTAFWTLRNYANVAKLREIIGFNVICAMTGFMKDVLTLLILLKTWPMKNGWVIFACGSHGCLLPQAYVPIAPNPHVSVLERPLHSR